MSLKRTVAIAAAAGALAAISVPAMAFENEFHGTSRLRYFLSNYENGGGGNPLVPSATTGLIGAPTGSTTDDLKMNNYFESRTRIFYTAKASDDLKLVTGFEIDSVFGDRAQGLTTSGGTFVAGGAVATGATGRNEGGALESDTVNLETKWVYLDFKIPSTPIQVKAGIQPIKDQLKGIFLDADVAGILTIAKVGPATFNTGYFRGYDQSFFGTARPRGMDNLDIGLVEAKIAATKDLNFGAVYYLYADGRGLNGLSNGPVTGINTSAMMLHTVGLTADAKIGPVALSGFAAYQGGLLRNINNAAGTRNAPDTTAYLNALAFNAAAKVAIGPGTLKAAGLYTSGNGNTDRNHLTGWVGTSQSQNQAWSSTAGTSTYNESGMMLLNRNAAAGTGTTDVAIVYNTGNGTNPLNMQGLWLATMGFDAKITPKFYANTNVGAAWVARTNGLKPVDRATGRQNASNYMGTEVNVEAGYKMYDNLTASLQAAYVILGGYYNGSSTFGTATAAKDPENPYTIRTSLIFNF
ncbi:MAG: histidine kinase [Desulfuromonadales bacterium]|nr:histidine kinase [Desulfuromonadales bacterium]